MRYLNQFRRAKSGRGEQPVRDAGHNQQPPTSQTNVDVVEQAIHYMRENIEQHIVMDDVVHYVGYSQSHFFSIFKKKTGQSPIAYFNRLKVEHACHLLKTTDLKVNQICYKVGVEDALYFSRLFSKVMGMSPTQFKKANK